MNELLKEKVVDFLSSVLHDAFFGDGSEGEYVLDGFNWKGLNHMTDEELYEQLIQVTGEEEDLAIQVRMELDIDNVLREESAS